MFTSIPIAIRYHLTVFSHFFLSFFFRLIRFFVVNINLFMPLTGDDDAFCISTSKWWIFSFLDWILFFVFCFLLWLNDKVFLNNHACYQSIFDVQVSVECHLRSFAKNDPHFAHCQQNKWEKWRKQRITVKRRETEK